MRTSDKFMNIIELAFQYTLDPEGLAPLFDQYKVRVRVPEQGGPSGLHPQIFGPTGTAFELRNFLTLTTMGGVYQIFWQFAIYWFSGEVPRLGGVLGSNPG